MITRVWMYVLLMIAWKPFTEHCFILFIVDSLEIRSICTFYARDLWCLYSLSLLSLSKALLLKIQQVLKLRSEYVLSEEQGGEIKVSWKDLTTMCRGFMWICLAARLESRSCFDSGNSPNRKAAKLNIWDFQICQWQTRKAWVRLFWMSAGTLQMEYNAQWANTMDGVLRICIKVTQGFNYNEKEVWQNQLQF